MAEFVSAHAGYIVLVLVGACIALYFAFRGERIDHERSRVEGSTARGDLKTMAKQRAKAAREAHAAKTRADLKKELGI